MFKWNSLYFSLCLLPLALSLGTTEQSLACFLQSPLQVSVLVDLSESSPLQLNRPSSLWAQQFSLFSVHLTDPLSSPCFISLLIQFPMKGEFDKHSWRFYWELSLSLGYFFIYFLLKRDSALAESHTNCIFCLRWDLQEITPVARYSLFSSDFHSSQQN